MRRPWLSLTDRGRLLFQDGLDGQGVGCMLDSMVRYRIHGYTRRAGRAGDPLTSILVTLRVTFCAPDHGELQGEVIVLPSSGREDQNLRKTNEWELYEPAARKKRATCRRGCCMDV